MTLMTAKTLLTDHGIGFTQQDYPNETAFYEQVFHVVPGRARPNAAHTLLIQSKNGKKHLFLEFLHKDGHFVFEELFFGEYAFGFFDHTETVLPRDLMDTIMSIISGKHHVIVAIDPQKERLVADAAYILSDDSDEDDTEAYEATLRRIERPRRGPLKFILPRRRYEVYDWYSVRQISL